MQYSTQNNILEDIIKELEELSNYQLGFAVFR
jgi:hypothetical protein